MPRGKYTNHKGRSRKFTSAEELEEQRRQDERIRQRRLERGDISSESEPEEKNEGSGSDSEESDSDDGPQKVKGVENLIEVENPNRIQKKTKKAPTTVNPEAPAKPELSRREREEIEKARASAQYQKLHAEGRTAQAQADLARLAIVKQQREEAAKRREAERLEKEAAKASKTQQTQRALGKKTT
ncbi:28 kDa heat- and acid-stable phosphoprotein [Halyomorpha halys]|uniref:28 kDa heat- and acid-stable phosphoprotein n=1 Tax=Halyomorpha halys TaxID=286706 RepID=UPI0006D4FF18|nr:28 kDa heat- and acid-stable phosphoprotein-like [Halyomorpha halys]